MASDTETLFAQARLLTRQGRSEDARRAYIELLHTSPDHFGALNNLGALLHDTGYRNASRTVYARAVACHPENPMGHVNLANALRDAGDLASARHHCTMALALDRSHAGAHRAMALVLADLGQHEAAGVHRKSGFEHQPPIVLPCRGDRKPISLLLLVSAVGGNVPVRHLIDDHVFHTCVIYADYWDAERPLPAHDLAFNTIGDADLCQPAVEAAARLLASTKSPVLNLPAHVLRTGRAQNAARLSQVPGVKTARTISLPRATLCGPLGEEALRANGFCFPLLLRTPGYHTGQNFDRVGGAEELEAVASRLPGKDLMAIEFLDSRGADGKARKYRAMFVNGEVLPLHLAISNDWKVHYFSSAMADSADYHAEEAQFLNDMPGVIGARGMSALYAIRDALGLDYAGIDFGLNDEGDILLFEANATMVIIPPSADRRWDYRRPTIARVESAVRTMLADRARAKPLRAA